MSVSILDDLHYPVLIPIALDATPNAHSAPNYPLASLYPTPVNPANGTVGLAATQSLRPNGALGVNDAWEHVTTQWDFDLTPRSWYSQRRIATGESQYNAPGQYTYDGLMLEQNGQQVDTYPGIQNMLNNQTGGM